ncbi:integrase [Streptomyces griseus]|uniref:hypothetical protein n=1 Tax=Streptomyces griseus TaxID=1911 RepID=UPI0004C8963D|nr:hypothetical protein [Streptomyces griseus]
MNLTLPQQLRAPLFRDDEPVIQGRPQTGASDPGGRIPRFGDTDFWDFNSVLRRPANVAPSTWRIRFAGPLTDPYWNLLTREVLMIAANPTHRAVINHGLSLGSTGVAVATMQNFVSYLRRLANWAAENGLPPCPDQWTSDVLRRRIKYMRDSTTTGPATTASHVTLLRQMTAMAPALSLPWPSDDPWPGKTARQVADYPMSSELVLKPVPPHIWFPLIRAAWTYIHTFAPDILRASHRYEKLKAAASTRILGRHEEVRTWLADPANKVPVRFENGRPTGSIPQPNYHYLALLLGFDRKSGNALFHGHSKRASERCRMAMEAVAEGRFCPDSIIDDLVHVTRPDGSTGPWHPGIDAYSLYHLRIALRNAAFVLVVGLSMMRDSEVQEITRDSVVEHYSSPAIASTLHKGRPGQPRKHWWITEPVAEAIAVAELLTESDRIFAAMPRRGTQKVHGVRLLRSFIDGVNQGRAWSGLDEIPDGYVRPHMFRRTMAMLTDQFAGSEIALGIQLKHIATRALANAATRGYAAGDASWAEHLKDAIEVARFRKIKDLFSLHKEGQVIGFGPGADRLTTAFDQIISTAKARGGDARVEEDLLRKTRVTIRFGALNNCLYDDTNPSGAVCLEHAVVPPGHTGPLHDRCRPDRCGNSMIGIEHIPIHDSHRRTQLKLLQTPGLPACRKQLITRELERVEAILDKAGEART